MLSLGEPNPDQNRVEEFAAEANNPDLAKYLAEDKWAPTALWIKTKHKELRTLRNSFLNYFVDTADFSEHRGRKIAILAGCTGLGTLLTFGQPTPQELYEQTHPTTTTTTVETDDDCAKRVTALVTTFPEYADQTPLLLARCRDGQSLVIEMMTQPTTPES